MDDDENYIILKLTLCNLCNILHDQKQLQELEPKSKIGRDTQEILQLSVNENMNESCKKFLELFSSTFNYQIPKQNIECNICYGSLFNNNYAYKFSSCSHIYCNKCTSILWQNKRSVACPICKTISKQYFKIII